MNASILLKVLLTYLFLLLVAVRPCFLKLLRFSPGLRKAHLCDCGTCAYTGQTPGRSRGFIEFVQTLPPSTSHHYKIARCNAKL